MRPTFDYDPLDPAVIADPYPTYRAMREHVPVCWNEPMQAWVLTRYQDCRDVLQDHTIFTRDQRRVGRELPEGQLTIQVQDPPDQTELRRLIMESTRGQDIDQICADARLDLEKRIASHPAGEPFDVMAELAAPLAMRVTNEIVGVNDLPVEIYHPMFIGITRQMDAGIDHDPSRWELGEEAGDALSDLMRSWFDARPDFGMIGDLQRSLADKPLPAAYVQRTMCAVYNASYSTLFASTGDVLLTLLQRPEALAALANPDLLASGVDELMRFICPAQGTSRHVTAPTTLGDVELVPGDVIITLFAAANRDPEKFADPDELTLDRTPNAHLGFGWGSHICAGARVAITWVRELVQFLVEHPGRLDLAGPAEYMCSATLRNLASLPVAVRS